MCRLNCWITVLIVVGIVSQCLPSEAIPLAVRGRRGYRHRAAAFQVVRDKPLSANRLDVLKFDNEVTNLGNNYNNKTGVFTAPVLGIYVFNLQVVASRGTYVEVSIQRTGSYGHFVNVVKAMSDKMGKDKTSGGQGTAVAVLRLKPGEKVTTSVSWITGKENIEGGSTTSFSGYLLY